MSQLTIKRRKALIFRRFFRHIKEGFFGVFRHFGMSFSSASAVMITLVLIGLFLVVTINLYYMTRTIESSISLSALIELGYEDGHEDIERAILAIDGVASVDYRSPDEEFDYYLETQGSDEMKAFLETYREDNPFRGNILVEVEDSSRLAEVAAAIARIEYIDEVADGGSNTYTLIRVLDNVRLFGGILVAALCVLAIYLVYNTIKITIASRADEIWIMRNVGAKSGYVRAPFLVEGIIIGFLGAIVPMALAIFLYYYAYDNSGGNIFGAFYMLEPLPFIFYVAGALGLTGIVVGFVGSYISVCKYLRLRR